MDTSKNCSTMGHNAMFIELLCGVHAGAKMPRFCRKLRQFGIRYLYLETAPYFLLKVTYYTL